MKIRSGFVSNSSSSSFILDANKYTCVDIAKKMTKILHEEDQNKCDLICDNLDKLTDKNTSIFIDCSDDINICKVYDKIYVEGTYHLDWELDNIERGDEGEFSDIFHSTDFYIPEIDNKILVKLKNWETTYNYNGQQYSCSCGYHFFEYDKKLICPKCMKDPDGNKLNYIFRENKLNRVLKDEN